jgi:hypothetical protein
MTDTRKLLDDSPDELTQRLLRSALDDQPSSRAFSRTAVALGVSSVVPMATTGAAAAGSASATGTAVTGAATTSVKLFGLAGFKWLGLGAIAGLIVAGAASSVIGDKPEPTVTVTPVVTATTGRDSTSLEAPTPLAIPAPQPSAAASSALKKASQGEVPGSPNAESERRPSAKTPTIAREIAALDGARAALERNDPTAALAAVDSHEREGAVALGPEATVIRVEALLARGETSKAKALARRFLVENPSTPHATRMREVIHQQK